MIIFEARYFILHSVIVCNVSTFLSEYLVRVLYTEWSSVLKVEPTRQEQLIEQLVLQPSSEHWCWMSVIVFLLLGILDKTRPAAEYFSAFVGQSCIGM